MSIRLPMPKNFIMTPWPLIDIVSDSALRLWIIIRKFNGETDLRGCWAALKTIDIRMIPGGRVANHVSHKIKNAHRDLVENGLLVVIHRGPGRSALRWAIWPGEKGDIELDLLLREKKIDFNTHRSTYLLRSTSGAVSALHGGPESSHHEGHSGPSNNKNGLITTDSKHSEPDQLACKSTVPGIEHIRGSVMAVAQRAIETSRQGQNIDPLEVNDDS